MTPFPNKVTARGTKEVRTSKHLFWEEEKTQPRTVNKHPEILMLISLFTDPRSDESWEFPGGLVVRSPGFQCCGPGSNPGLETGWLCQKFFFKEGGESCLSLIFCSQGCWGIDADKHIFKS